MQQSALGIPANFGKKLSGNEQYLSHVKFINDLRSQEATAGQYIFSIFERESRTQ